MHDKTATLNYSFGGISIKVGVEGNVDHPAQLVDHMVSTAVAAIGSQVVQLGISDGQRDEGALKQSYINTTEFGEIKVYTEITLNFNQRVSKRKINTMVLGNVLPLIWQTASIYLGSNQQLTTPVGPLAQTTQRVVSDGLVDALALRSTNGSEGYGSSSHEPRQLVGAH